MKSYHVIFYIDLGHGLESKHARDALDVRHNIERDMSKQGFKMIGGGMGFGGMDVSVFAQKDTREAIEKAGRKIIAKYGLKCSVEHTTYDERD